MSARRPAAAGAAETSHREVCVIFPAARSGGMTVRRIITVATTAAVFLALLVQGASADVYFLR